MYLLLRDEVYSNEPIGSDVLYPCSSLEWTDEALEKIPAMMREKFEESLREIYSEDCGYGDCEAYGATFEELAPALEFIPIEEIGVLKGLYDIEGALFILEWTDENACDPIAKYL